MSLASATIQYSAVAALAPVQTGVQMPERLTRLNSQAMAQIEHSRTELARSARLFCGGISAVAGAIVPVVDLPTTTAPMLIYNAATPGAVSRSLVLDRVSVTIGSGTTGAAGFTLFVGVTAATVATPITANASNTKVQATRGTGLSVAFIGLASTIPAGTAFVTVGGIMTTAVAVTGCGYSTVMDGSFVAPPGFGLVLGILGDTGTSAKYVLSATWGEYEFDLP